MGLTYQDMAKFVWNVTLTYTVLSGSARLRKDFFIVFADHPNTASNKCKLYTEERLDDVIEIESVFIEKRPMDIRNHVIHREIDIQ